MNHRLGVDPISLVIERPTTTPFDLSDDFVKAHLALDGDALDSLIMNVYLPAAVQWAEDYMHRTVMAREHRWVLRDFPRQWYRYYRGDEIWLPRGKTVAVRDIEYARGESIVTMTGPTSGGSPGEELSFQEDLHDDSGGRLLPLRGRCWPSADCHAISPVVINFRAGYEEKGDVPENIKHALLFAIDDMMEVRGVTDLATLVSLAANGSTFNARAALLSAWRLIRLY